MTRILFLLLALLLPTFSGALEVTSIAPASAPPGSIVTISGGPFTDSVTIRLGEQELTPLEKQPRMLQFQIPPWPAGDYLLALRQNDSTYLSPFIFRIAESLPSIRAIFPEEIDVCSTPAERQIRIIGEHFGLHPKVLLDGAAVPFATVRAGEIILTVPQLAAGHYSLQVLSAAGSPSIPQLFTVNGRPRIDMVTEGKDDVVSYELMLTGSNLSPRSLLLVDGLPVAVPSASGMPPVAAEILPRIDFLRFIDCHTLVYIRHPFSREIKTISLQVVNPDGSSSPPYTVAIP